MKKTIFTSIILGVLVLLFQGYRYAEGMFPLSDIPVSQLKKAGMKISAKDLYNPNGTSLIDALVRVGGCTGSFISEDGLIITNHHCAFSATVAASTPLNDYLTNGFYATSREKELKTSISCRITISYEDVSAKILENISENEEAISRQNKIKENISKLTKEVQAAKPGFEIEISEMLPGTSYTLFTYQQLKDVRLVYVPSRSVGEFGGESDNWVWPRHTGDFAILRAYVGKNGEVAEYNTENKPFTPKKILKINQKGVKENDFVMVLGYPGRTFRNAPYKFVEFQNEHTLKNVSKWYDFQINAMLEKSTESKEIELSLSSRIKSLANVTKNYKGKLQGLKRTSLLSDKKQEEAKLQSFIEKDEILNKQYGNLFAEIDKQYDVLEKHADRDFYIKELFKTKGAAFLFSFISFHSSIYNSLDNAQKSKYIPGIFSGQTPLLKQNYAFQYKDLDKKYIGKILYELASLPDDQRPNVLDEYKNDRNKINALIEDADEKTNAWDQKAIYETFEKNPEKLINTRHPMINIMGELYLMVEVLQNEEQAAYAELESLNAKLFAVKQKYHKTSFLPDANATLRLTYGKIRGYSPNDAEIQEPFTTIAGIIEKADTEGDYYLKSEILDIMKKADATNTVCLLYDLDTTGGNSGSPILDANGDLVGVNFDRATSACINDYGWNEAYSRSIGVDIRYVIFILKEVGKADELLAELKVK